MVVVKQRKSSIYMWVVVVCVLCTIFFLLGKASIVHRINHVGVWYGTGARTIDRYCALGLWEGGEGEHVVCGCCVVSLSVDRLS